MGPLVHRDLKPDNIMLVPDALVMGGVRVKLLDFGIAKIKDSNEGDAMSLKTRTGTLVGTPTYMSPEQCRSQPQIDGQSDVYALGVIFYELLAGGPPFRSTALGEMMALHLFAPPRPLRDSLPQIPAELEALVLRMLAKKPEDRPTAAQVAAQLAQLKVSDEELARDEGSDDRTQAAISAQEISDLAMQAARGSDERSLSMQGVATNSTMGSGAPSLRAQRRRRLLLLQAGIGVALLLGGAGYWVSQLRSRVVDPTTSALALVTAGGSRAVADLGGAAGNGPADLGGADGQAHKPDAGLGTEDALVVGLREQLQSLSSGKALRLLKRTLKQNPKHAGLLELACDVQLKAGKLSDAIKSCEKALAIEPERASVRALLQAAKRAEAAAEVEGKEAGSAKDSSDKDATGAHEAAEASEPAAPSPGPKKPDAYNVDFLR